MFPRSLPVANFVSACRRNAPLAHSTTKILDSDVTGPFTGDTNWRSDGGGTFASHVCHHHALLVAGLSPGGTSADLEAAAANNVAATPALRRKRISGVARCAGGHAPVRYGEMGTREDAERAFDAGDLRQLRELLKRANNPTELIAVATFLTATNDASDWEEGTNVLRGLADNGNGHAAHNLSTALMCPPVGREQDRPGAAHYLSIAVSTGFEATVSYDSSSMDPTRGR